MTVIAQSNIVTLPGVPIVDPAEDQVSSLEAPRWPMPEKPSAGTLDLGALDPIVLASKIKARRLLARNLDARRSQERCLRRCVSRARSTVFGKDHGFDTIETHEDFKRAVPLRDGSEFAPYWERTLAGEADVCWPGKPNRVLSSGGTTSGDGVLIPVTEEGLSLSRRGVIHAGMCFMAERESSTLLRKKQVILGASWDGDRHDNGAIVHKLSGAGPASVPSVVRNHLVIPSEDVANERDFEKKLDLIVEQALSSEIAQISSTPVWLMAFFERVGRAVGLGPNETLKKVWPTLEMVLYTGASVRPYENVFRRWLGDEVALWEVYGATEGMVAIKESSQRNDMLVLADQDAFFEFIPVDEHGSVSPTRLAMWEVEVGHEYVIAMTNANGLFAYVPGDTVRFTSVAPHRLVVSGRTKFFLNTVGEHVDAGAIEEAIIVAQRETGAQVREFTVGPAAVTSEGRVRHEWVIEFSREPDDQDAFARLLDDTVARLAADYRWYRSAGTVGAPVVRIAEPGAFAAWIRDHRNNDPQTKVPKVRNDRQMLEQISSVDRREEVQLAAA